MKRPFLLSAKPMLAFCLASLLITVEALALVNPETLTDASPNILTIEIIQERTETIGSIERYFLRARVLIVHKSVIELKRGDSIAIYYERDTDAMATLNEWFQEKSADPGWAGDTPRHPPSPPSPNDIVRAYLQIIPGLDELIFAPAAAQYSFEFV